MEPEVLIVLAAIGVLLVSALAIPYNSFRASRLALRRQVALRRHKEEAVAEAIRHLEKHGSPQR